MTEWIDASERLPEKDEEIEECSVPVLVYDGEEISVGFYGFTSKAWFDSEDVNEDISHWMTLPEIPKKKHWCSSNDIFVESCENKFVLNFYDKHGRAIREFILACPFCGERA